MAILRSVWLRNNTIAPLEFLGIEIAANSVEDFSYESDIDLQTDPTLVAAIQAGDISIGDGVTYVAGTVALSQLIVPPLPPALAASGIQTPSAVDITSLAPSTALDQNLDYTVVYDASLSENRKATIATNRGFTYAQLTGIDTVLSESMMFVDDTTRLNKMLSVENTTLAFGRSSVSTSAYLNHAGAKDSTTGPVMPYKGTIVRGSLYCEDAKGQTRAFSIYINGIENTGAFNITGLGPQSDTVSGLDIDFAAGDRIRIRARGPGGKVDDTNVIIWCKWRI